MPTFDDDIALEPVDVDSPTPGATGPIGETGPARVEATGMRPSAASDEATELGLDRAPNETRFRATMSPDHWVVNGPNGGYLAAVLAHAVDGDGTLVAHSRQLALAV